MTRDIPHPLCLYFLVVVEIKLPINDFPGVTADDYVTKPFSMEELLARVKARLRRTQPNDPDQLQFEDLILNGLTREVYRGSQLIELTAKEFDLL